MARAALLLGLRHWARYLLTLEASDTRFLGSCLLSIAFALFWLLGPVSLLASIACTGGLWAIQLSVELFVHRRVALTLHRTLEQRRLDPAEITLLRQLCDRRFVSTRMLLGLVDRAFPSGHPKLFNDIRRDQVYGEVDEAFSKLQTRSTSVELAAEIRGRFSLMGRRTLYLVMLLLVPIVPLAPLIATKLRATLPPLDPPLLGMAALGCFVVARQLWSEIDRRERVLEARETERTRVDAAWTLARMAATGNDPRTPTAAAVEAMADVLSSVGAPQPEIPSKDATEVVASTIKTLIPMRP
jgi:hypothetical protein